MLISNLLHRSSEVVYKYSFDQEVIFTLREWGKKLKQMYIVSLFLLNILPESFDTPYLCRRTTYRASTLPRSS